MSFNYSENGKDFKAGHFLAHEECTRITVEVAQNNSQVTTLANGAKYIKAGTPYPSNDANAKGLIYEDVDVTKGNMPASLVTAGTVVEAKLPVTLSANAKTALTGIKLVTEGAVTRPWD